MPVEMRMTPDTAIAALMPWGTPIRSRPVRRASRQPASRPHPTIKTTRANPMASSMILSSSPISSRLPMLRPRPIIGPRAPIAR